jgi:hypothetical protein
MIAPLERERGRFKIFCGTLLVGGVAAGVVGSRLARRRSTDSSE